MGRSIVNAGETAGATTRGGPLPGAGGSADDYGDRLLKLIPAEVIALYMAMDGVITDNNHNTPFIAFSILGICMFATWFYLRIFLKVDNKPQIIVSVIAFAIWAINIGHGWQQNELIPPSYAALALLIFTFFAPKIPMGTTPKPLPPL